MAFRFVLARWAMAKRLAMLTGTQTGLASLRPMRRPDISIR
jgi:hypothetical protein